MVYGVWISDLRWSLLREKHPVTLGVVRLVCEDLCVSVKFCDNL